MRIEIDQTVGRVLSSTIITDSIHFDLIRRTAKSFGNHASGILYVPFEIKRHSTPYQNQ